MFNYYQFMSHPKWRFSEMVLVSTWSYDAPGDDCVLCKGSLTMQPTGSSSLTTPEIVQGQCNHAFHKECMDKWRYSGIKGSQNTSCPIDNSNFVPKKDVFNDKNWFARVPKIPEN